MRKLKIPGTSWSIYTTEGLFSFGVDVIVLSDFAKVKKGTTLMDIGAGFGIIGLRMKALYDISKLYCVEIQTDIAAHIRKTVQENNITGVTVLDQSLQSLTIKENSIDNIVSNPPYLKVGHHITHLSENDQISRTEKYLTLEELFTFSKKVLKDRGSLFLVHRADRLVDILSLARKHHLEPKVLRFIKSTAKDIPKLLLIQCQKNAGEELKILRDLVLYDAHCYTKEVLEIYGDYK